MGVLGLEAAAAVGTGQDLEEVAVRVVEVHAPAVVPMVDPARVPAEGIRPVRSVAVGEPPEDLVELLFGDEER
jgi:hypothetical protein